MRQVEQGPALHPAEDGALGDQVQARVGSDVVLSQRAEVALQPEPGRHDRVRVIEVPDPTMPGLEQHAHGRCRGVLLGRDDRAERPTERPAVQEDGRVRQRGGRLDLLVVHAREDHPRHLVLQQRVDGLALHVRAHDVTQVDHEQQVPVFGCGLLRCREHGHGERRGRDLVGDETDRPARTLAQVPRRLVRPVVEFCGGPSDAFPSCVGHADAVLPAVEDDRDGGDGHVGTLRHVLERRSPDRWHVVILP